MARATPKQVIELGVQIERGNLDEERVQAILDGRFAITEASREENPRGQAWVSPETSVEPETYPLTVDYGMTVHEMFVAGNFSEGDEEHLFHGRSFLFWRRKPCFPSQGKGVVNLVGRLLHTSVDGPHNEILREHARLGLRPAVAAEILAFGAQHPAVQCRDDVTGIVAAGQLWWDSDTGMLSAHAVELGAFYEKRFLSLFWWNHVRGPKYRFLAFPIEAP